MKRLFWLAAGAGLGVAAARRLRRATQALTPRGIADGVAGEVSTVGEAVRAFADDVRAAMAEREDELRDALGLDEADGTGESARAPEANERNGGRHRKPGRARRG